MLPSALAAISPPTGVSSAPSFAASVSVAAAPAPPAQAIAKAAATPVRRTHR